MGIKIRELSDVVVVICLCIIFGGCVGIVIGKATTHPLTCRVWSWQKNDWKTVNCLRVGSDVTGPRSTPEPPTATEYADETEVEPPETATATVEVSGEAYPKPEATWTPIVYPAPEGAMATAMLEWWRRLK